MSVIHLHNPKPLRVVGGTAVEQPTFSATVLEIAAIRRFLEFAQADVKFQFDEMNRQPGVSRDVMEEAQVTAVILSNYLKGLKEGLSLMAAKPETA